MCYTATQVSKAYEYQSFYVAKLSPHITSEDVGTFYKADGFAHPDLVVIVKRESGIEIDIMKWGLLPSWKKPLADMMKLSNSTLNAKRETIWEKPSFKGSIVNKRCIIPVNSFFEYKHVDGDKLPYLIYPKSHPFFNLAGIYSYYKNPDNDQWIKSFSIITQEANEFMADIHNTAKRMPLMLSQDLVNEWLNPNAPRSIVDEIMQYSCDDDSLAAYRVRRDLKKLPNDESVLIPEPI